jgi:hypothetical protein
LAKGTTIKGAATKAKNSSEKRTWWGSKKKKVEDDNGPNVPMHNLSSPSGIATGGGKGKPGPKNDNPQSMASVGRHSDRSSSSADDIPRNNATGPYGVLPDVGKANNNNLHLYEAHDSPLGSTPTVALSPTKKKAPSKSRNKDGATSKAQPAAIPNANKPILANSYGSTNAANGYDKISSDILLPSSSVSMPQPLPKGPSNATKFFRKIKPETKKGVGIYTIVALVAIGGIVSLAVTGALGLLNQIDDNLSNIPKVANRGTTPGATGDKTKGVTKTGISAFKMYELATAFDTSENAKIDPGSFLLYASTLASEPGSKTVTRQGEWTVSDTGLLSFKPDQKADFGTAEILFSVADKIGRRSNRAVFSVHYGPMTQTVDVMDLDPETATQPITLTRKVYQRRTDKDSEVDFSTLELVYRDDDSTNSGGDRIGAEISLPMIGDWKVTNGSITFTPALGFMGTTASIGYRVRDKRGILSNESSIVLFFRPKSMKFPPTEMMKKPVLGFMPDIIVNTQPRVDFMTSSVGTLADNTLEISDSSTGAFDTSVIVENEGSWEVNGNALAFNRSPNFLGTPAPIYYRAKNTAGVQSDIFEFRVAIFPPPLVKDDSFDGLRATIDVLANDSVTYGREDNRIDRTSLEFMKITSGNPADPVPQIYAEGKKAIVAGQGEWEINQKNQWVTFVPIAGFDGVPLPIYYSVKDTKGSESGPAKITINSASSTVSAIITDLQGMQAGAFWSSLRMQLAGRQLDEVLVAIFLFARLSSKGLNDAQLMQIGAEGVGLTDEVREEVFKTWMKAKFSVATLIDQVKDRSQEDLRFPTVRALPANSVVLRVLRLGEMIVALDKYFDTLESMRT